MNRIELLDLVFSYLKINNDNNIFQKEQENLLMQNNNSKDNLLKDLETKFVNKKHELYSEHMKNIVRERNKKAKEKSQMKFEKQLLLKTLRYMILYLISIITSFVLSEWLFNFLNKESDVAKHGLIITITNILTVTALVLTPNSNNSNKRDLIRILSLLLNLLTPILAVYLYKDAIFTSLSTTLSTYYYYFTSIIITLIVVLIIKYIIIATKFIQNKDDGINSANPETKLFISDNQLKQAIGFNKQKTAIIESHHEMELKIRNKIQIYNKRFRTHLAILNSYIPQPFQNNLSLFLLVEALQNGYAQNWQQAIIWIREENRHAETQENLINIAHSINNIGLKLNAFQKQLKEQHDTQLVLMNSINQNLETNTTTLNALQKDINSNFSKLTKQNRNIISEMHYMQLQSLLLHK